MFPKDQKQIWGIWNVSSDSFSSGAEFEDVTRYAHAQWLCREGADIVDIGAESTRPGVLPLEADEEIARLGEPLEWVRTVLRCPISLDSRHPKTIAWALDNDWVDIINDIGATTSISDAREGEIYRAVAQAGAAIVLMAWFPHEADVLPFELCMQKVVEQLKTRLEFALKCGIDRHKIILDPGIGFGKGLENDWRFIAEAPQALAPLECPVLIAHSRKRCIAKSAGGLKMSSETLAKLDAATAMASLIAFQNGAAAVRVHAPALNVIARQMATHV